ncbi:hypothetical protein DFQ28_002557 [Apophysomyces sp. BC1034]|nr:hypothetical protein DFQ30_006823 [Apophysomyces sp. BC1015]KAG0179108.1 hypothetical protein DFQ29_002498 [Apophysomyces sp. BC1021]KAG0193909.1 hypothetical protein DFQ28_002557 [Apophysomyces sp. BC1034]
MSKLPLSSDYMNISSSAPPFTNTSTPKLELTDQPMMYSGPPFYVSPMHHPHHQASPSSAAAAAAAAGGYFYDPSMARSFAHSASANNNNPNFISPSTPPPPTTSSSDRTTCEPATIMPPEPPMLVASSSSTTTASTMSTSSVEYLNETIAKASSLPEAFYPEFLQYSKETYEQSTGPNRKKQRRTLQEEEKDEQDQQGMEESEEGEGIIDESMKGLSSAEMRRQIHIQSEQKRRAQIKDGFEDLRNELPTCLNKKMSKVALLHRTVQHIQHLKDTQYTIMTELQRLVHENEQLRKFQDSVLQKQALENMYSMGNM